MTRLIPPHLLPSAALAWPFFLWLAGLAVLLPPHSFDFPAYVYAAKTMLCAGLVLALRPWRFAPCGGRREDIVAGLLIGFAVYVLWALPESTPWPEVTALYRRWLVMMPGALPDYGASWCYAWEAHPVLATVKLIGSAFVIAPIEEFFFRGFLMRWLTQRDWRNLPLAAISKHAFWATALVFAFEHDRFVMGLVAGLAYGALAVRTGSLRASIAAHVLTNLLLGLHVLLLGAYGFW